MYMYKESAGFDHSIDLHGEDADNNNDQSNYSMGERSYNPQIPIFQLEIQLQHHLNLQMEQSHNNNKNPGEIQKIEAYGDDDAVYNPLNLHPPPLMELASERHRRALLNSNYEALRQLVPAPIKTDRASVVKDAIIYINELKRTVAELKALVEERGSIERPKIENDEPKSLVDHMDNPFSDSPMRSSWLHRKSKSMEVDVRIIDDEVTVKLVQQKRINCLLFVSKVLDELQLDLHHVAGGLIGDYYSFLFNSKICEGSIVCANAVANKLIEVVNKQYAAIPPTNSY